MEPHPDLFREQARVTEVTAKVARRLAQFRQQAAGVQSEIVSIRRDFWEDVTVNLEDAIEAAETMASIRQQAEVMSEQERSHQSLTQQIRILGRLEQSPYFGRIDFLADGEAEADRIYIGIASFVDDNGEDFLIHDWRAPICSVYYDHEPGPADYRAPAGVIQGTLERKRQFLMKAGKIVSMFDTAITIGDQILQEILGSAASPQMKSIVGTIQREQNRIIRNTRNQLLVVQGVAGSGKTSTALQRIAYLLYHERESLRSENVLLFSPNPLFSSYVSNVLPELGEESMRQLTYQDYVRTALGKAQPVEDIFDQTEYVLTQMDHPDYSARLQAIRYKSSMDFKDLMDRYIAWLAQDGLEFRGIKFRGSLLISRKDIKRRFYAMDNRISIPNRLAMLKRELLKELKEHEIKQRSQRWVEDEVELLDEETHHAAFQRLQSEGRFAQTSFDDFSREQALLAEQVVHQSFRPLRAAIAQLRFVDVRAVYANLFNQRQFTQRIAKRHELPEEWPDICAQTLRQLETGKLAYEDAAPFLYLKERLTGIRSHPLIRHVFIDEAQDYSAFQLACIRQLFPHARMTLLGDPNQAIHLQASGASAFDAARSLYPAERTETLVLNRSYRPTREIVEFTRRIVEGGERIEPFERTGIRPTLTRVRDEEDRRAKLLACMRDVQQRGHRTIAIICKTAGETRRVYESLRDQLELQLVDEETVTFRPEPLVIPSYLAKGVEFDAVLVYDASEHTYSRDHERTLFYTVCTRAMHELHLFSQGTPCPWIDAAYCDVK
ncbi:UvrD-helicase domain-containing protein [Alicyclobacillus cycloheptanicus]|uniref:DNA helicase-2/ATP-dependent DNA helicase PcrA n=1 Tax=Alicyclobacillus cycloheptanicus TaxID=1457 RepID=A0ABT9XFA7_9BACL|nr:RNA polymerase recycling motor HelD [Alicyclobacillus cycloheptanicus]MDQ0188984.1 DNA helicase-2/ATP-dependent DNA helicase PcrA [Alicyclobacillus cycloheptanicus]WDM01673.1 UvrD-helicase domain-containing protein [Alicyclobacillus cycloheptanicus]